MAVRITVDLREVQTLLRHLGGIGSRDLSALTAELAQQTVDQTNRRYDQRRAPDGKPWPPRKDSKPHPLLEKSGRLRRSIQARALQEREATIGTAGVPYAVVHQEGRGPIPARTFLGWGGADLAELTETAEAHMARFVGETL